MADLCAGPGGKSAVLAAVAHTRTPETPENPETPAAPPGPAPPEALAPPEASAASAASRASGALPAPAAPAGIHLLASDVRPHRAGLTRAHLRNLPGAAVVAADGRAGAWRPGTFDRVLADVPCSGLGALRRRPEARWRKSPEDVENLGALQRALLNAAIDAARPGGVVAYVTCSPHRAETHDVLRDVLASRNDTTVLDAPAILADALRAAAPDPDRAAALDAARANAPDPDRAAALDAARANAPASAHEIPGLSNPAPDGRYAQFWPHRHGTDAIFLALLRRAPVALP